MEVSSPPQPAVVAAASVITITTDECSSQESGQEEQKTEDDNHQPSTVLPTRVKGVQREEITAQESILAKLAKVVEPFLNKESKKTKSINVVQVPYHPQPTSKQRSRSHSAGGYSRIDEEHPLSPDYPHRYPTVSQTSPVRKGKGKENQTSSSSKLHSRKQNQNTATITNNTSSSSMNRSSNVSGSFAVAEMTLELQNERTENVALKQHIASLEKQLLFARAENDRAAGSHRSITAQHTGDNASLRTNLTQVYSLIHHHLTSVIHL